MRYDEVARDLGVSRCNGRIPSVCAIRMNAKQVLRAHQRGRSTLGTVHFLDRRMIKTGLRRFLILAIEAKDPSVKVLTPWLRIWMTNVEVTRLAKLLGVAIPRHMADKDRARVRFYLSELSNKERAYYGEPYTKALRWAARS